MKTLMILATVVALSGCTHVFTAEFEDGTKVEYLTVSSLVNDNIGVVRINGGDPILTHHDSTLATLSPWASAGAQIEASRQIGRGLADSGDDISVSSASESASDADADVDADIKAAAKVENVINNGKKKKW